MDSQGVRQVYATWIGALEAGDIEKALPVLAPDVVFEIPSGERLEGREAVRAAIGSFLADHVERVTWSLDIMALDTNSAEVRVREVTTVWPRKGGEAFRIQGWHTGVLRRTTSGWQIVRDVSTLDRPPEPVADPRPENP